VGKFIPANHRNQTQDPATERGANPVTCYFSIPTCSGESHSPGRDRKEHKSKQSLIFGSDKFSNKQLQFPLMPSKEEILGKIKILITQSFATPEEAFNFFDKDDDARLNRNEIKALLKDARVSGFIRSLVAGKLLDEFDGSDDEQIGWEEFEAAVASMVADEDSKDV